MFRYRPRLHIRFEHTLRVKLENDLEGKDRSSLVFFHLVMAPFDRPHCSVLASVLCIPMLFRL